MCLVCCQRSKDYPGVSKPRMHTSEVGGGSSCSRFKHCAMHSAIRSPTLNPIGAIGLRATDDDLSDRSGRAEFEIELRARIARVLHSAGYGAELAGNQKRAMSSLRVKTSK